MPTVKNILNYLDNMIPFETQEDFDNAGFLVGRQEQEVTKVLVALDATIPVIHEACELGAQLIVTHHPVIFHPSKSVTNQSVLGRKLMALVGNDISVISAHTNLDVAQGGVNDVLAKKLGLNNTSILRVTGEGGWAKRYGLGRLGVLKDAMEPLDFATMVKEQLDAKALRVSLGNRPIVKVAVGGGSCGDMLGEAAQWGCDAFVTGDVKYDQFLEAAEQGITMIDGGHFATENLICATLADWLASNYTDLEVLISAVHKEVCIGL